MENIKHVSRETKIISSKALSEFLLQAMLKDVDVRRVKKPKNK